MNRGVDRDSQAAVPSHDVCFARPAPTLADCLAGYHSYDVRLPPGEVREEIFFPAWANIRFQLTGKSWAKRYGRTRIDPIPMPALQRAVREVATALGGLDHLVANTGGTVGPGNLTSAGDDDSSS